MPVATRRASPRLRELADSAHRKRAGVTPCVVFFGATLLSGCAVGPDFERPEPPPVSGYTVGRLPASTVAADGVAQRFYRGRDIPGEWWSLFRSKDLTALIQEGLANNPDLEAALAALRIARENTRAQVGFFFPSVEATFDATWQTLPADVTTPLPSPRLSNIFTGQVRRSCSPD